LDEAGRQDGDREAIAGHEAEKSVRTSIHVQSFG
jgi:hypothetical protein